MKRIFVCCSIEFFIEDRSTHSGPFHWPVRPSTTLLELKERTAKSHNIKVECQRWILGRRLADQDQLTLKDYDIWPSNSSLFLYVLNEPLEAAGHINGPVINKDPPTLTETVEKQQPETTADQGLTKFHFK